MAGARGTTKKRAQRIDLNYFKRPNSFRRWRSLLSLGLPLLALLWLAAYGLTGNDRVYSSGRMSAGHAVLAAKCGACHVKEAGFFSTKASDQACRACHDGPIHHANQTFAPNCSSCHEEHRGLVRLAATADVGCTQCHANLHTVGPPTRFARNVRNFGPDHPEFAAVRHGSVDPGAIKLNHAIHLKPNLKGPNGPVQLDCDDCHRPPTSTDEWRFGSTPLKAVPVAQQLDPPSMASARAYMAPVSYARHCRTCHGLQFDKRFAEGVPHDTPEVVHVFVVQKFQQYIATHPAELRATDLGRDLPQKPLRAPVRVLTPQQWVIENVGEAEQLLWRKTCKECHSLSFSGNARLPTVAKSNVTARWFQHAVFNHDRHRMLKCQECHPKALISQETADILVPGIRTCEQCHHAGAEAAESRCFQCHTYHDWSKEKEIKGKLTLSGLVRDN